MVAIQMNPEIDVYDVKQRMIDFRLRAPTEADVSGRIEILEIVPLVAFIAVRPSYRAEALCAEITARLDAEDGVVWVAYTKTKCVYVHDRSNRIRVCRGSDVLTGWFELPGFALPVSELFHELTP
jgi:hypothetical protein